LSKVDKPKWLVEKYKITLQEQERQQLKAMTNKGTHAAHKLLNALIFLNCDEAAQSAKRRSAEQIAQVLQVSARKIDRIKQRFVQEGFEAALNRRQGHRHHDKVIDGDVEAHVVALSCSQPPAGRVRWTLRLLAQKAVELQYVEAVSHEAIRQTLKKRT
jgi:transposase